MMQSGTKESTAQEVEMGQIEGPVLTALISFMYGQLPTVPSDVLLPLFVAADAHQACYSGLAISCVLDEMSSA